MVTLDVLKQSLAEIELAKDDISPQDFDQIASCVEKEEMETAVELIQSLFEVGNFDIRLISYYLYAHFLKKGVRSFIETLPIFQTLIGTEWKNLKPIQRKEKQVESSFNWFFTHVINKLKYNERLFKEKKPLLWSLSTLRFSEKEFAELQETLKSFNHFFQERWAQSPVKERVPHLIKKVTDLKPLILEVPKEEMVLPPIPEKIEKSLEIPEVKQQPPPPLSENTALFETPEMMSLMKKLAIFEALIEKKNLLKAALVSADINQAIAHFDPSVYFPKLFASYFSLLARHSSSIADQSESLESLQWKSLEKLYKADLDQFIEW